MSNAGVERLSYEKQSPGSCLSSGVQTRDITDDMAETKCEELQIVD